MSDLKGLFIVDAERIYKIFSVLPDGRMVAEEFTFEVREDFVGFTGFGHDEAAAEFVTIPPLPGEQRLYQSEARAVYLCTRATLNHMRENGEITGYEKWVKNIRANIIKLSDKITW